MNKEWNTRHGEFYFLLLILGICCVFFLCNLGNHYLWQDEAQTALISKTIIDGDGIPRGYDGQNYLSQEKGAEYGENHIWKWHTWLTFYVVAFFFKIFGTTTFAARLPFALFGVATVFMTYYFCKACWKDKRVAVTATVLLLSCVPFLILCRQCRWYSLTAFFSMWALYSYVRLPEGKKSAYIGYVAAVILLFHTHYFYVAALIPALGLHAFLFHRKSFKMLFLLSVIAVGVNIPWIIWLSGMKYGEQYGEAMGAEDKFADFIGEYLRLICLHIFTYVSAAILPLAVIGHWIKTRTFITEDGESWKRLLLLILYIGSTLCGLAIASPYPYTRYLTVLFPLFIILIALLVIQVGRIHLYAAIAVLIAYAAFNPMTDFVYELTHDYDGPIEGLVLYLNEHAHEDDVVLITYGDMPLKFYTNLRVLGGLTAEDLSEASEPDWIIIRMFKQSSYIDDVIEFMGKINLSNYEKIYIDYPDLPFENREEPENHLYRTASIEEEAVVTLYRKKK